MSKSRQHYKATIDKWWANAVQAKENVSTTIQDGSEVYQKRNESEPRDYSDEDADSSDSEEDAVNVNGSGDDEIDDDDDDDDDFVNYDQDVAIAPVLPRVFRNGRVQMELPGIAYVLPVEVIPTRSIVYYKDYVVYVDSRPKTSVWAVQCIKKENWAKGEHWHCELNRFACSMSSNFQFGRPENYQRLTLVKLLSHKLHKVDGKMVCSYCNHSNFWKVFHQYIWFLLEIYDKVNVCSGVLHLNKEDQQKATHFFKVICCKNPEDSTYRFECYKIRNERMTGETPELRKYLVSREKLEEQSGLKIFNHVRQSRIKERETHLFFKPKKNHKEPSK